MQQGNHLLLTGGVDAVVKGFHKNHLQFVGKQNMKYDLCCKSMYLSSSFAKFKKNQEGL